MTNRPDDQHSAGATNSQPLLTSLHCMTKLRFKFALYLLVGAFVVINYLPAVLDQQSEGFRVQAFLWFGLFAIIVYVGVQGLLWSFRRLEDWRKSRRTRRRR